LRGSDLERELMKLFEQKVTWAAPHIKAGDTWEKVAKEWKQ
jgi:hypothetical protein